MAKRTSLVQIADAISVHTLREVVHAGGRSLWFNYQGLVDLIQQYGKQKERAGYLRGLKEHPKQ